ncbi:MAG: hypothetical protein RIS73_472 [Bacteroidota bacterium]|jgi:gamma-glutamylcyclotransferase (GGCT)/AIG2-like uncharacterized protein YtfP
MEIDRIIEGLNKNKNISGIALNNLEESGLTEVEKNFIKLYRPQKSLIIYGTLAPNKPNHAVIEHIKGKWQKAIVRGKLEKKGWGAELGYYGFKHSGIKEQDKIEAHVLFSDELIANWQYLDDFEGDGYRRILAKYELDNGTTGVGYIYAINQEEF